MRNTSNKMTFTVYYGAVINPQKRNLKEPISYNAWPQSLIAVSGAGKIVWMCSHILESQIKENLEQIGIMDYTFIVLQRGEFIMPGFIDSHTHAPQFPNLGVGQEYQLLEWLERVVYPMEGKFSDMEFAQRVYPSVVRRSIDFGTTTCCYYGSIHLEATKLLVDIVRESGQRALIGKCNMDREVPENNKETTQEGVERTEVLIDYIQSFNEASQNVLPLLFPVITPRFAISCTPELLTCLGKIAASDKSLHIQTHISENVAEVTKMGELFPGNTSYADVYNSFGLLRPRTILGHAVHLSDDEVQLIADTGAGISHCPTSNFNLTSGIAPVGKYLDAGVKVGLGTDVGGGYNPSILNVIQNASIAAKMLAVQAHDPLKPGYNNRKFSVATLLYLATLGGAQVCGLDEHIGSFETGKTFDALVVRVTSEADNPGLWPPNEEDTLKLSLERFFFCGDDRNIARVYVQGKLIGGKDFQSLSNS